MKEMVGLKIKSKRYIFSAVMITLSLITVGQIVSASTKDPGSQTDPLVTLSYVDLKINQLKDYIDQKTSSGNPSGQPDYSGNGSFQVVEMKSGQSLIAGEGTEVILRSGEVTAIISPLGGLTDVTAAKDLQQGEKISANHLLIIPRSDGRGALALTDAFLLVKGTYTLK